MALFFLAYGTTVFGVCPEDPFDRGLCDTMYIDPWAADTLQYGSGPYFVRVPIFVTADVFDKCDSILGFVIPLCYTHTNAAKYCSLTYYYNNFTSFINPQSIFRHLISDGDTIRNWMMDLYEEGNGEEWNAVYLELASDSSQYYQYGIVPAHFWLALLPSGSEDRWFGSGNRILLATITFKIEDTMSICFDTCFWPPGSSLGWSVIEILPGGECGLSYSKIPRLGSPHQTSYQVCFNLHHAAFLCGDVNADAIVDIGDVVYLINYLFKNGIAPNPIQSGDVNGDSVVDVGDVVYLINYLFKNGPKPCE